MVSFPAASPKHPPFFLFLNPKPYCVLFRVLCDTLNPKKRHSRSLKKTFGGGVCPQNQERSMARVVLDHHHD